MNVWVASREYAGIAEAGGVKNVARSLSEALVRRGHTVTLFIPLYACTDIGAVERFECVWHEPVFVNSCGRSVTVTFCHGTLEGVHIIFVSHRQFAEKKAVYVYTQEEERLDPGHRHGTGHRDALELNALFQKAVVAYGDTCAREEAPDVIHCHDAPTALIPPLLALKKSLSPLSGDFYGRTRCVVTIHNAGPGYHHHFDSVQSAAHLTALPVSMLEQGMLGQTVEPFLLASRYAALTTVSPQYAREILDGTTETAGLGQALRSAGIPIIGITNGIDFSNYDPGDSGASRLPFTFCPEKKELAGKYRCREHLVSRYASEQSGNVIGVQRFGWLDGSSCDEGVVHIAYHGRVVRQKGIGVLAEAARVLLGSSLPVRIACIGQGEGELEDELSAIARGNPGRFVYFRGYDRALARLCTASADFSLFPSVFEPCGLEDFISQIYGTIPVAHATGGLCKIADGETGFLYRGDGSGSLLEILEPLVRIKSAAPDIFLPMIAYAARNTRTQYSWDKVASLYERLFRGERI